MDGRKQYAMDRKPTIPELLENLVVRPTQCRVCSHRWQAVFLAGDDACDRECPNCGCPAGEECGAEL